ncbi:MAG: DMT family transporter [Proteobacteria bacterium]|nr:DMT family transporter [Pseudomonadota bacterium]
MSKRIVNKVTTLAILACILWSTAFVAIKIGLEYSSPLFFAGVRFMISGLILLPFCGGIAVFFREVTAQIKTVLLVSLFQTFLLYALFYTGMTMVSGAFSAIVIGSSPLVASLMAHIFMKDDKLNRRKASFISLGIGGIAILSFSRSPWGMSGTTAELLGILILLVSTVSSAAGNIVVAKTNRKVNPFVLNSAQLFLGGFCLFVISIPMEGVPATSYQFDFYVSLLWLSILSAATTSIWFSLLRKPEVKVSELNVWKFIVPVFGAILSWIMLPGESPELVSVIGMALVAVSIVLFNLSEEKRKSAAKSDQHACGNR